MPTDTIYSRVKWFLPVYLTKSTWKQLVLAKTRVRGLRENKAINFAATSNRKNERVGDIHNDLCCISVWTIQTSDTGNRVDLLEFSRAYKWPRSGRFICIRSRGNCIQQAISFWLFWFALPFIEMWDVDFLCNKGVSTVCETNWWRKWFSTCDFDRILQIINENLKMSTRKIAQQVNVVTKSFRKF